MTKSIVTSALLRKAVQFRKATGKCVEAVAIDGNGDSRFLTKDDVPLPQWKTEYFERCPACGKEAVKFPR